jgi:uncharacterized membrane protein
VQSADKGPVTDSQVQALIGKHCGSCHAAQPTHVAFATAPAGVVLDNLQQIRLQSQRIYQQVVATQVMPLGNTTQMTSGERQQLGHWLQQQ